MIKSNDVVQVLKDDGIEDVSWGQLRKFENTTSVNLEELREKLGMGSWAVRIAFNERFGGVVKTI